MAHSATLSTLGTMAASISHELKNPLSVILGQTVLLEETSSDASTRKRADRIANAAERCSRIAHGFLDMARRKPVEYEPFDMAEAVTATLELTEHRLRKAEVDLVLEMDPDLPLLVGDCHQWGQVLMNLIVNATQAMEAETAGSRLPLAVRQLPTTQRMRLWVEDSRPGLADADATEVFSPFYTTRAAAGGTGLGLAVVHDIAAAHDGEISVSEGEFGGARFEIVLPTAAPGEPPAK